MVTGKRQGEIRDTVLQFLDRYHVIDARNLGARGRLFLLEPIDDATSAVSSPIGRL